MDVLFFFSERTRFLRQFYGMAAGPFVERKRKINDKEEPFEPPYCEDGEPAFLAEWIEAHESLHVLAYSCISMLAGALHLYFESWVHQSGRPVDLELKKEVFKKQGKIAGYRAHFEQKFRIDFGSCPADLKLLEEIILARNVVQHPTSITSNWTRYSDDDLQKLRPPFFLNEREAGLFFDDSQDSPRYLLPTVHISEEQLIAAIGEAEKFAGWFEEQIVAVLYGPSRCMGAEKEGAAAEVANHQLVGL